MAWLKKLFCVHPDWTESPMIPGFIMPPPDWRINTRYFVCVNCLKLKNVGYNGVKPLSPTHDRFLG